MGSGNRRLLAALSCHRRLQLWLLLLLFSLWELQPACCATARSQAHGSLVLDSGSQSESESEKARSGNKTLAEAHRRRQFRQRQQQPPTADLEYQPPLPLALSLSLSLSPFNSLASQRRKPTRARLTLLARLLRSQRALNIASHSALLCLFAC